MLVRRTYETDVHRTRHQGIGRPSSIYLGEEALSGVFLLYNGITSSDHESSIGWRRAVVGRVGDRIPRRKKQTRVGENPQAISRAT